MKLRTIVKALNEGEVLHPYCGKYRFEIYYYGRFEGLVCCESAWLTTIATAYCSSRLTLKSKVIGYYCAEQFKDLWLNWFGVDKNQNK